METICLPSLLNNNETIILQDIILFGKPLTLKFKHTITNTGIGNQWLLGITDRSGMQFIIKNIQVKAQRVEHTEKLQWEYTDKKIILFKM